MAKQVHHTTYANVGHEFLFELVALCPECHNRYHATVVPRLLERVFSMMASVQPPQAEEQSEAPIF